MSGGLYAAGSASPEQRGVNKPETRNQKPETRSQKPEVGNQKSEVGTEHRLVSLLAFGFWSLVSGF
jgi:hypothetical protein